MDWFLFNFVLVVVFSLLGWTTWVSGTTGPCPAKQFSKVWIRIFGTCRTRPAWAVGFRISVVMLCGTGDDEVRRKEGARGRDRQMTPGVRWTLGQTLEATNGFSSSVGRRKRMFGTLFSDARA